MTTKRHIDGVVQVISQSNASKTSADHLEYVYQIKDHLGSIVATVNHTGAQLKRYSYDAWGQRRGTDWSIPGHTPSSISGFTGFTSNLPIQISQTRGFTGHEHVDNAGLIHMNGRIYDPVLGRFMSADPYIQAATNAQSLNRYSYVWNNPLNATDPSGYIAAAIVGWTIGKIGASLASKFVLAKFIFSAYQVYNLGKAVLGIAQAYSAWNDGGGGAIWGNLIGGIAKGAIISWGLDSLADYGANVNAGTSTTDTKNASANEPNSKVTSESPLSVRQTAARNKISSLKEQGIIDTTKIFKGPNAVNDAAKEILGIVHPISEDFNVEIGGLIKEKKGGFWEGLFKDDNDREYFYDDLTVGKDRSIKISGIGSVAGIHKHPGGTPYFSNSSVVKEGAGDVGWVKAHRQPLYMSYRDQNGLNFKVCNINSNRCSNSYRARLPSDSIPGATFGIEGDVVR